MKKTNFSKMGQIEDIDKNHYRVKLKTFTEEAFIKNMIAEVRWLGCSGNLIKFSIKNLSEKTIPFGVNKIKIIDTDDNILECEYIDEPPKGWISNINDFDIYDDMLVKFIFAVLGIDSNTIIKRFLWTQPFYVGDGWKADYSIFDFSLDTSMIIDI